MTAADQPASPVLPYPHARNDCRACRERDADVEVLDEHGQPRTPRHELCRLCFGNLVTILATHESGPQLDQPVAVLFRPAEGRR
ncbi:hypothetical protein [Amycolatopsis eburnea]|uniref:Uncharacterized protein n=1 Tax=Amycolatopsis eburnea TaxID=2267691 RepID=A0A427TQ66_9PSEU|nr:hypothetical protein [Amycolatopsis eburnea]RSD26411.1 hypothetical protein EIY87_00025 [Amycolatopsis eburnea]